MAASNTYSYQPGHQQQLVPHYGPNYDPYNVNQNQNQQYHYQQQQAPPAFNPSFYYSPSSAPVNGAERVPAHVNANPYASEPSMLSSPSIDNLVEVADDNDIPDEIIKSQQMAWKSALERNQTQETTLTNYSAAANSNLVVPRSQNPTGSDAVHPHKKEMKEARKVSTAAAATGGALMGAVLTGPAFPVGALLGGAVTGYAVNKLHKHGERKAQRKWEQSNFQLGTHQAPIFQSKGMETVHTIV